MAHLVIYGKGGGVYGSGMKSKELIGTASRKELARRDAAQLKSAIANLAEARRVGHQSLIARSEAILIECRKALAA